MKVNNIPNIDFSEFSETELLEYCYNMYLQMGIECLTYDNIAAQGNLYFSLYRFSLTQKLLLKRLNLENAYREYKDTIQKWSYTKILKVCKGIISEMGFLPPSDWFRGNGYGSLITALYSQHGKSFIDLRGDLGENEGSSFVISKNGMRWRSHPEASFSNFLYARGIPHASGRKYEDDYAVYSNYKYGYYDVQFTDLNGNNVDVEIWGDKPNGHQEDAYAAKREIKERYNQDNKHFLSVEFKECYNEIQLQIILEPYIGVIKPFIFHSESDKIIPTTHWSNADELIAYCKEFIKQFPNKEFPTEEWLRKRGKWKDREGEAYNTLSVYIKTWIGGVRKLRKILDQEDVSTIQWDRNKALKAYKEWYDKYNMTTGSAIAKYKRKVLELTKEEKRWAACVDHAVLTYVGSVLEAQRILGIPISRQYKSQKK